MVPDHVAVPDLTQEGVVLHLVVRATGATVDVPRFERLVEALREVGDPIVASCAGGLCTVHCWVGDDADAGVRAAEIALRAVGSVAPGWSLARLELTDGAGLTIVDDVELPASYYRAVSGPSDSFPTEWAMPRTAN